jgi:hypothetical protein
MNGSSREFWTMGESLIQQHNVEDEDYIGCQFLQEKARL